MPNLKETLIALLMPGVKAVGKLQLKEILSKIQVNNNKQVYDNTLKSIHSNFTLLKEVAIKSKTKIDDDIIDLVLEAVAESAEEDGVVL